jgi:GAF domain-containing protein
MAARFGLGRDVDEAVPRFHFETGTDSDLFAAAVRRKKDLLFPRQGLTRGALPGWYVERFEPASFALLPVLVNHVCVGLIYCESDVPESFASAELLNYLHTLRNQAALAIRQRS